MTKETIDKQKLLNHLQEMIDENYKTIEDDPYGDANCEQEIDTLENIIFFINRGFYN